MKEKDGESNGVKGVTSLDLLSKLTVKFQGQYSAGLTGTGKRERLRGDGTGKGEDFRQDDGTGKDEKIQQQRQQQQQQRPFRDTNGTGKDERFSHRRQFNGTGKDERRFNGGTGKDERRRFDGGTGKDERRLNRRQFNGTGKDEAIRRVKLSTVATFYSGKPTQNPTNGNNPNPAQGSSFRKSKL